MSEEATVMFHRGYEQDLDDPEFLHRLQEFRCPLNRRRAGYPFLRRIPNAQVLTM